jgi:hypothetical protein
LYLLPVNPEPGKRIPLQSLARPSGQFPLWTITKEKDKLTTKTNKTIIKVRGIDAIHG